MTDAEKTLLVASVPGQCVDFFDTRSWEKVARIENLVAQPHEMTYDARRGRAYLTHYRRSGGYASPTEQGHEITVIDVERRSIERIVDIAPFVAPHDIEYDPVADLVYASIEPNSDGANGLLMLDPESWAIVDVVPTEPPNSHWCAVAPTAGKAYVTHKEAGVVSVVDVRDRKVIGSIGVPGGAEEVDCSPDGRWAYVVTPQNPLVSKEGDQLVKKAREGTEGSHILKIDTETDEIVGDFAMDLFPSALRAGPKDTVLISQGLFGDGITQPLGPLPGKVWVVDTNTMGSIASITVDRQPFTIRIAADGSFACVANVASGLVNVIDLQSNEVMRTLANYPHHEFGGSHGMCLAV